MKQDRLLRREEVESITTLSRSSLYRKMRAGSFPEPIPNRRPCCSLARIGNPRIYRLATTRHRRQVHAVPLRK